MKKEYYHIREATAADVEALVALHYRVFDENTHYSMLFGRRFIRATYLWYCRQPEAFAFLGFIDGEIRGACTVNQGSYYAVFRNNLPALAVSVLANPMVLFKTSIRRRLTALFRSLIACKQARQSTVKQAYLAYLAVDSSARGRGMGKALVQRAVIECESRAWGDIVGAVHRNNLPARFMYKTLGFAEYPLPSHDDLVRIVFNKSLADENRPR
jgi:ribosomal protein S18 acetylase RimI-like enzyme